MFNVVGKKDQVKSHMALNILHNDLIKNNGGLYCNITAIATVSLLMSRLMNMRQF